MNEARWFKSTLHVLHETFHLSIQQVFASLRITTICIVPILIGLLTREYELGVMSFIGGLYVVLADVGGAYRQRAWSMGLALFLNALAALLATLVGGIPWLAIPLAFLWASCFGLLGVFGNLGSKVSFVVVGIFVIALGEWASPLVAGERFIALLLGGALAMGLSLWLWPFRPYLPARTALADYYRALQIFVAKACDPAAGNVGIGSRWIDAARRERAIVMTAHDHAYATLIATRADKAGASPQSQQLLLLSLNADRLLDEVIALTESIEYASRHAQFPAIREILTQVVQHLQEVLQQLAFTIADGRHSYAAASAERSLAILAACEQELQDLLPQLVQDPGALINLRAMIRVVQHIEQTVQTSAEATSQLNHADTSHASGSRPRVIKLKDLRAAITLLLANITPSSLVFRYALRLGATTALAVALYSLLHIPQGYWITLTIVFILRPDFGATSQRTIHRIGGTVAGGIIATALAFLIHNEIFLLVLLLIIGFMAFAHLAGRYSIFVTFLTLFVVILLNLAHPGDWQIALIRIMNTLIGAAMALLAGYLFWPQWERERLPEQLATTLAANRLFFAQVLAAYLDPTQDSGRVHAMSNRAHVENANAATAFQRLLSEPRHQRGDVQQSSALVLYNQRFCDSITTLAEHIPAQSPQGAIHEALTQFKSATEQALRMLEQEVHAGQDLQLPSKFEQSFQSVQATLKLLTNVQAAHSPIYRPDTTPAIDYALVRMQIDRLSADVFGMVKTI